MKVIGAGLPRTGTLSQKVALEMLGFGPCYHMVNILTNLPLSHAMGAGPGRRGGLGRAVRRARVDRRLAGSVLLSRARRRLSRTPRWCSATRDPEAWEKSMRSTIWGTIYGQSTMAHISKARELVDPDWRAYMQLMSRMWAAQGIFAGSELRPGQLAEAITRYQELVQRNIPEDRLLVWSVGRRLGAAVRVPRGRRARGAVPTAQRLEDVHRPDHRRVADGAQGVAQPGW